MESNAVWNLKLKRWGSPLVQKYREEKACDKRKQKQRNNNYYNYYNFVHYEVIATRNYVKFIFKDPNLTANKYRLCGSASETVQNVIASRPKLAQNTYKFRHD
jgi:hypothetical protein